MNRGTNHPPLDRERVARLRGILAEHRIQVTDLQRWLSADGPEVSKYALHRYLWGKLEHEPDGLYERIMASIKDVIR